MSYDPQYQPPVPPQKKGMGTGAKVALGCGIPAFLALVVLGGCAAFGGAVLNEADKAVKADAADDKRAAKEDVSLLKCEVVDSVIGPEVKSQVKITNNGKKRANYYVEGEFLKPDGNKVGELVASINNLEPGKSTTQDFSGLITSDQLAGVTKGICKIIDVTRDEWLAAN